MSKKPKHGFPLPQVIDPPRICIQLSIPDDPDHLRAFWGALFDLTRWFNWQTDNNQTAKKVADVWHEVWLMNQENWRERECMPFDPCCPDELLRLDQLIELTQTLVNNQTTLIDQNTTLIDNDTTIIDQNETTIINNLLSQYNNFVTNNQNTQILNQMLYDGTPQSIYPEAGENFDSTGDDILCAAIDAYIRGLIYLHSTRETAQANAAGIVAGLAVALGVALSVVTAGASAVLGAVIAGLVLGVNVWANILNDPQAIRKVKCCMFDSLKGQPLTREVFQTSVTDCGFDAGTNESILAQAIDADNYNYEENYLAFLRAMNQASGGNAQDCACDCDDAAEPVPYGSNAANVQIIPMGNCIYRIVSTNQTSTDHGGVHEAGFKDLLDRPIRADYPGDPYVLQAMTGSTVHGACGDPDYNGENFGGGFIPSGKMLDAHWWTNNNVAIDTYLKITLVPPEECV